MQPTRPARAGIAAVALLLAATFTPAGASAPVTTSVTYNGEIRAILQARCRSCHSRGGPAPMPLATYEEVRSSAQAIKDQILTRRMPKWSAAHGYGAFANDPSLTPAEMAIVTAWVDGGQPKGGPANSRPSAGSEPPALGRDALRLHVGATATEARLRVNARWIRGWDFEPGDPRITSAALTSADGTPIATWVAGDAPRPLPVASGIQIASPIHLELRRRATAAHENRVALRPSVLWLLTRTTAPRRRIWIEQTACNAPRAGAGATLLAVRPIVGNGGSARVWLERPGAPQVIVGWFRNVESLYPRTFWLMRPAELTPESRVASDTSCMVQLTLTGAPGPAPDPRDRRQHRGAPAGG